MPPRKIILKVGPSRVPRGGKSIKGPKKGITNAPKVIKKRRASSSSLSSTSSLDLSDEDGYSGVEDVSDSDDEDDEHVFAAEEKHIITNELHRKQPDTTSSPRPSSSDHDNNDDEGNSDDADDDDSDDENENKNDQFLESMDEDVDETGSVSWNGFTSENDEPVPAEIDTAEQVGTTPVERHVRFAGVPDSESDSDETEEDVDDFFPDIFIAQDSLDSNFRREIEQDEDDDSSVSATYWDYTGAGGVEEDSEDDRYGIEDVPNIFGGNNMNAMIEPGQSVIPDIPEPESEKEPDGYESDGETTEEDEPELVPRKKLMPLRRGASGAPSESDKSAGGMTHNGRLNTSSKKKPILVLNPVTRKMMIITPQRKQRRFDVVLDPEQFQTDYFSLPTTTQTSPIIGNPGALMMSAMSSANFFAGGAMDFQTIGPAEAFFPAASDPFVEFVGGESEDSFLEEADDEDFVEKNLNIEDFLDFGEEESDADGQATEHDDGTTTDVTPSRRGSTAPSATSDSNADVHPLLSHFANNADAVGAFRRNQVNQQLILNGQATQESLAFANPLYHGTLRGIKHGSLGGAATPLTPERRHKKANAKSPSDTNNKRKPSNLAIESGQVQKRQRSISDVKAMHL